MDQQTAAILYIISFTIFAVAIIVTVVNRKRRERRIQKASASRKAQVRELVAHRVSQAMHGEDIAW